MGPPRFRCATLIVEYILYRNIYNVSFRQSSVPIFISLLRLCLSFPSLHQHHKKITRKTIQNFDQNPQKISIKEAVFNKKGNEKETWYWWVTNSSCCKGNYCFFCWIIDSSVSIWLFINAQYKQFLSFCFSFLEMVLKDQYRILGENVARLKTDLMKEQLATFRSQLEEFAR